MSWAHWEDLYHKDPALYADEVPEEDEEEREFREALDSLADSFFGDLYPAGLEPDPEDEQSFWAQWEPLGEGQPNAAELPPQRWADGVRSPKDTLHLATVGYQGWRDLETMLSMLNRLFSQWVLVDVRFRPKSPNPRWRRETLQRRLGDRYLWLREWGNAAHASGRLLIFDYEAGRAVVRRLLDTGATPVLLCACRCVESCHRRVVAERFAEETGVLVCHIQPPQSETTPSLFELAD